MLVAVHLAVVAMSLLLVVRLLPHARAHFPMIALLLALGLLHGLIPAITPPGLRTMEASEAARHYAAWYSLFGIVALAVGYELYAWVRGAWFARSILNSQELASDKKIIRFYFWSCMVLGLVGASLYLKSAGVGIFDYAQASRFEFRHFRNRPMMWAGLYFFHLIFAPGFLGQFLSRRYRIIGTAFAAAAAGLAFFYLFKGTRHVTLGILSAVFVGYVLANRLTPSRVLVLGCTGGVLIFSTIALYEVRKSLNSVSVAQSLSNMLSTESLSEPLSRDPLNYHEHFVGAVEYFPAEHPFVYGATYRRMLTFFLPGPDFPTLKPEHTPRVFADVVYDDIYEDDFRATHPPSLFGDAYLNFSGWAGLIALAMNGFVIAWVTNCIRKSLLWFLAVGPHLGWFILLTPRGDLYVFFMMTLILILLTKPFIYFLQPKLHSRKLLPTQTATACRSTLPQRGSLAA